MFMIHIVVEKSFFGIYIKTKLFKHNLQEVYLFSNPKLIKFLTIHCTGVKINTSPLKLVLGLESHFVKASWKV